MTKITITRATVEQALEVISLELPTGSYLELETALRQALEQPNEFHPDWDQIKPFHDRIAELETVARQALGALEGVVHAHGYKGGTPVEAITELRQALEQQPMMWREPKPDFYITELIRNTIKYHDAVYGEQEFSKHKMNDCVVPVWFTPPSAKPQVIDKSAATRIATALGWGPKREWVGLTDEEFQVIKTKLFRTHGWEGDGWDLAVKEAIEAKLKRKNT